MSWNTYSRSFGGWALRKVTRVSAFFNFTHMDVALRTLTFNLQEDLEGQESQEDPENKNKRINNAVVILKHNPDQRVTHSLSYRSSGAHWTRWALQTGTTHRLTQTGAADIKGVSVGAYRRSWKTSQASLPRKTELSCLPLAALGNRQQEWSFLISLSRISWHLSTVARRHSSPGSQQLISKR